MNKTNERWVKGDKLIHPESGTGEVKEVYYWESKQVSCLHVSYRNGYCGTGTDQATHESNGWKPINCSLGK